MEKNLYLMINHLLLEMHDWKTPSDITEDFFQDLKLIIPFHYASLFHYDPQASNPLHLSAPICYPENFSQAEERYLGSVDEDHLLWILHSHESILVRESDLVDEAHRLQSPLYKNCYQAFHIYDSMQFTIVKDQTLFGVLTLFRTKEDGTFTSDDQFFLRAIGQHLNQVVPSMFEETSKSKTLSKTLLQSFGLTPKEQMIIEYLTAFYENNEIAEQLNIQESTLQKHLQNIFRKCHVSSRWELMRLLQ